jgi:hypothetical protein
LDIYNTGLIKKSLCFKTRQGLQYIGSDYNTVTTLNDNYNNILLGAMIKGKITDTFKLGGIIDYEIDMSDSDNYTIETKISSEFKITEAINFVVDLKREYKNKPVSNLLDKTEQTVMSSLVVRF